MFAYVIISEDHSLIKVWVSKLRIETVMSAHKSSECELSNHMYLIKIYM